jgi:PKD repeat protein
VVAGIAPPGNNTLLDKNHLWIDNSPLSPYEGILYNAWTCFGGTNDTEIEITRSTDGGLTWSAQTVISAAVAAGSHNQGVNIQTGPDGEVYVAWAIYDSWAYPSGSDEVAIGFTKSTNGGTSWSTPVRVNQDPTGFANEHYFPWITCDPETGDLCVIFYDDRNVSATQCEVYVAYSYDAGTNWEDFKVSDVAFTPTPIPNLATGYMGDYLGLASRNGKVYPVWPDNRTGTVMTYVSPFMLNRLPLANFTASNLTPCVNTSITFEDLSMKFPTSWLWSISPSTYSFVNGTSATSQNPQVSFSAYDNYTVQLIVSNAYGSDTLVRDDFIEVNIGNANFTANTTNINVGNSVTFSDLSTCTVSSYLWNFGSGATPSTAATAGPHVVTYSTPGFKNVSLTVNNDNTKYKNNYIMVDASYCTASATCYEYISWIIIGAINNPSACTSGGYQKYTQYWTTVSPGIGYAVTITNGRVYAGDQCRIWVDWNQDLDFEDEGETINLSTVGNGASFTGTITPPADAVKGLTRMRVRLTYTGTFTSCGALAYGETEDYSLYVGTPGLWEGGTAGAEHEWNTKVNWDDERVPGSATNVVIPPNVNDFPAISGSFSCLDMNIKNGATLSVGSGAVINILGDLDVGEGSSGVLIINGGTCNLAGQTTASPGSSIRLINGGVMNDND